MSSYSKLLSYCFLFLTVSLPLNTFGDTTSVLTNQVGYEKNGPKTALIQSTATFSISDFSLTDSLDNVVFTSQCSAVRTVDGWKNRYFSVLDFSEFTQNGRFKIKAGQYESSLFTIASNALFTLTAPSVVSFFKSMRNTDQADNSVPFFGNEDVKHDVFGGWNDATGDRGKYLSHLSFANYFNPQQIPFVVWSLLKSYELNPIKFDNSLTEIIPEAAWGADYLLRVLDKDGFFYINVFDGWGYAKRKICAWVDSAGTMTKNYQAGMREGGGMAIAALAKAAKMSIHGDSTASQYLEGAKRAYSNLKINNLNYIDDGKENIIDDYCGLLAAKELYSATKDQQYLEDATVRAANLIKRLTPDGWFYSDDSTRPFYHAADEGMPILALIEYCDIQDNPENSIRNGIYKSAHRYFESISESANPFSYAKEISKTTSGTAQVTNLALKKTVTASTSETSPNNSPVQNAVDGDQNTRWASGTPYSNDEWIQVDLGSTYNIGKVVVNWEAAYALSYKILTSGDGTKWDTSATVTGGAPGKKETSFSPVEARYVRMKGVERGSSYGYSIYEFEVYGAPTTPANIGSRFFLPHQNETGYWWQGENSRIASIASALILASHQKGLFTNEEQSTLTKIAVSQLDWILGKNPFDVCMMYGFGKTNYPDYSGMAGYCMPNSKGGICNGITSGVTDEQDIAWMPYTGEYLWMNWRWIEQWLPHDAWYLLAVSSLNYSIDNPMPFVKYGVKTPDKIRTEVRFSRNRLTINCANMISGKIKVFNLFGKTVAVHLQNTKSKKIEIPLRGLSSGLYLLELPGVSVRSTFTVF